MISSCPIGRIWTVSILVAFALLTACSQQSTVKPAENPVSQYVTDETVEILVTNLNSTQQGLIFSPSVNGTVTRLGCRLPEADQYRVKLWDVDAKTVLKTVIVNQAVAKEVAYSDVDAVKLTAQKQYAVTVDRFSLTLVTRPPFIVWKKGNLVLPFTKGSLVFSAGCYGTGASFPTISTDKTAFYGFPDFTFIPD